MHAYYEFVECNNVFFFIRFLDICTYLPFLANLFKLQDI